MVIIGNRGKEVSTNKWHIAYCRSYCPELMPCYAETAGHLLSSPVEVTEEESGPGGDSGLRAESLSGNSDINHPHNGHTDTGLCGGVHQPLCQDNENYAIRDSSSE